MKKKTSLRKKITMKKKKRKICSWTAWEENRFCKYFRMFQKRLCFNKKKSLKDKEKSKNKKKRDSSGWPEETRSIRNYLFKGKKANKYLIILIISLKESKVIPLLNFKVIAVVEGNLEKKKKFKLRLNL